MSVYEPVLYDKLAANGINPKGGNGGTPRGQFARGTHVPSDLLTS